MNKTTTPEEAIKVFLKGYIEQGYIIQALHQYYNYDGTESYIRARLIHKTLLKCIRPFYKTNEGIWSWCG